MSITRPRYDSEANPRGKAVLDNIRATRETEFINDRWLHLVFKVALLERIRAEMKCVMARPSSPHPLTKELIYIAVIVPNGRSCRVHLYTAAAKARGMAPEQHGELAIVAPAGKTDQLPTPLQVPVDAAFDASAPDS